MALVDVIESMDAGPETLVQRWPALGSGQIKMGSQLVVRESQWGVFFRDGKGYDVLGAGRHTLSTANLPVLTKFIGDKIAAGGPFKAEVYFVSQRPVRDLKWGTAEPVVFRDKELAMVRLRCFGIYSIRVTEPLLFVNKVVGTEGRFEARDIESFLRGIIVGRLQDVLGEVLTSILDLAAKYDELGAAMKGRVREDFAKYGLEITDFYVNAITPPPEVQAVIDERTGMAAVGNLDAYYKFKAAKGIEKAAEQSGGGGGAGAGMGMGVGLGMGMTMAQMMGGAMRSTTEQPCPKCGKPMPTGANFCPGCGTTMNLPDQTLIICPKCQADNSPTAKFCAGCGEKLPIKARCAKCGGAVDAKKDKFCPECGEKQ